MSISYRRQLKNFDQFRCETGQNSPELLSGLVINKLSLLTIREFCFSKEFWVTQALANMPPGLKARMELRMPIVHERPSDGSPLHQALVKVGVNIERFFVRTHTMSALYAVTGWEDPLSFSEWRLTSAYLFGFTSPTYNLAETSDERRCPCGKELDVGGHHVQCCAKHARGSWVVGHNAVQARPGRRQVSQRG